jgi:3-hydroxyacyl-[acyl-carrier-protein] dehydratase
LTSPDQRGAARIRFPLAGSNHDGSPLAIAWLPHRYPFLLLDRILMVDPGRWCIAVKNVTRDEPFVDARGEFPPILLAEVMAQAAGVALGSSSGTGGSSFLAKIDRFRCRPPLMAGDRLLISAKVVRTWSANGIVRASVYVDGNTRAASEVVLHLGARP